MMGVGGRDLIVCFELMMWLLLVAVVNGSEGWGAFVCDEEL